MTRNWQATASKLASANGVLAELDADGVYYGLAAAASLVAAGAPEEKVRFAPDSVLEQAGFEL